MRTRLALFLLSLLVLFLPAAVAFAEPDAPARLRIATFDLGKVERGCKLVLEGKARIDKTFAGEKKAFEALQADVERLAEELQHSMFRKDSPEYREQLARFRAREREMKEKGSTLLRRIGEAKSRLLGAMYADLKKAVAELCEEEEYDLVFQLHRPGATPGRNPMELVRELNAMDLFHAHPRFDITDRILARMDSYREAK